MPYTDVPVIPIVSATYKNRRRSNLIKWLMREGSLTVQETADRIGTTKEYLNNKLVRDSFSIEDILRVSKAANKSVFIVDNETGKAMRLT